MSTPTSPTLPSTASIALATGILCALAGYYVGLGSSIGLFSRSDPPHSSSQRKKNKTEKNKGKKESWPNSYDVAIHPDSSDEELMKKLRRDEEEEDGEEEEEEEEDDDEIEDDDEEEEEEEEEEEISGELKSFEDSNEECKLILAVRTDLGMTKGKIAAQASHATLACYKHLLRAPRLAGLLSRWESQGQAKIAVQIHSEDELETVQAQAWSLGLCAQVVRDAGRTQIPGGTRTVVGVGPGPKSVVDLVTGRFKLL